MNKVVVIYHANCSDGLAAAGVCYNKFGDDAVYLPGVYGEEPPFAELTAADVYFVDFGYTAQQMKQIVAIANRVVWLDHHVSTYLALKDISGIESHYDVSSSGCAIAFNYFNPTKLLPPALLLIQDRDLWRFEMRNTRAFTCYLSANTRSIKEWGALVADHDLENEIFEGTILLRRQEADVLDAIRNTCRIMSIDGYLVKVANCAPNIASDAANILAKGMPFAATYYDSEKERVFSLRSIKDDGIDVSIIAGIYGGGGHKHAAGFKVSRKHFLAKA